MKLRIEFLVSATAMITAVAAVVVAMLQTQVMEKEAELERQHQRLSVLPRVFVYTGSHTADKEGKFWVGFINQGIGPAVLEQLSVKLGDLNTHDWDKVVTTGTKGQVHISGPDRNVEGVIVSAVTPGMVIPAGDKLEPIRLETTPDIAKILRDFGDEIEVSICYCSLYRECWHADNRNARPVSVNQCQNSDQGLMSDDQEGAGNVEDNVGN